jgi:mannosyl-oligosaccharide alpha-1,2-mannosidase
VYKETADRIFQHVAKEQRSDGIVPDRWNVMTGLPVSRDGSLGSGSDSFYEYLLKVPLAECARKGDHTERIISCDNDSTLQDMLDLYKKVVDTALRTKQIHRATKGVQIQGPLAYPVEKGNMFHHLLCFLPGLVALGSTVILETENRRNEVKDLSRNSEDMELAKDMLKGCQDMYEQTPTGLGPEDVRIDDKLNAASRKLISGGGDLKYLLRPEYVESIFILYRTTGDPKYQEMGWKVFQAIERFCRTDTGYTGLLNVYEPEGGTRVDDMPSYFIAETLKYLLLLFAPDDYVPLDNFVFTTEAHPLLRLRPNTSFAFAEPSEYVVSAPFPWVLWSALISAVVLPGVLIIFLIGRFGKIRMQDRELKSR